jgi:formylglycine-generating enzyme required for sulfatase activity
VTIKAFKIDRTEVTNAQYAEFMNQLPVKPTGSAQGSKVSAANIPVEWHALLLEFSTRPAPYTYDRPG